jgi:hypothetical protein
MAVFEGSRRIFEERYVELVTFEFCPGLMKRLSVDPVQLIELIQSWNMFCFDVSDIKSVPNHRPSDNKGFTNAFYHACKPEDKCSCDDDMCLKESYGKWDELLCANMFLPVQKEL